MAEEANIHWIPEAAFMLAQPGQRMSIGEMSENSAAAWRAPSRSLWKLSQSACGTAARPVTGCLEQCTGRERNKGRRRLAPGEADDDSAETLQQQEWRQLVALS
jgi:hypothetical protein